MSSDARWVDSMPEVYDHNLGPALFDPYAVHLAAIAAAAAPRRVLELAAGTGLVTARLVAALPDAVVTATDLNPAMVQWAAQRVPGAEWLVADAQRLDFPDDAFDLVVCQFGVMFFPDRVGAYAEAARVLAPGGMLLVAVWDTIEGSEFPTALVEAYTELFPDDGPPFLSRVPHGYHDPAQIRADVEAGGFRVSSLERVVLRGHADSARTVAEGYGLGSPMRFELEQRGDLSDLVDALAEKMTARLGAGPVSSDLPAFVMTASPSA